jgi:hypothetical protein
MEPRKPLPPEDDPDLPISEEEKVLSQKLRDALDNPTLANEDAEFARSLALANEPRPIAKEDHDRIVARAIADAKPRGQVIRVLFGVAALVSAAAAAVLVLGRHDMAAPPSLATRAAELVPVRSTQDLFNEPFARPLSHGAASARIDRIAMARQSDLRENRFAMWGVR